MKQRAPMGTAAVSGYEDMPFSQVLLRYIWPFWLLKDATRGDRTARAAAYRHNRRMRIYLPGYLMRWVLGSALAYATTAGFESLAGAAGHLHARYVNVFTLMAAGGGIVFAGSLCVLLVTSYIYIYLGKHDF